MKAVTWQGKLDMQVIEVPNPAIEEPLAPFMTAGDVVGHEPMGIVRDKEDGTVKVVFTP